MVVTQLMRRTKKEKPSCKSTAKLRVRFLILLAIVLLAVCCLAPYFVPNNPYTTNSSYMKGVPCSKYPLGTDKLGRCIFSRVLTGAKTSISSALLLVVTTMLTGTFLGVTAGYFGGLLDAVIMRLADIFMAFPQMILAIAVAGVLGGSMTNAMLALGITGWAMYARISRGQVMALKEESFIHAARLNGTSSIRIILLHILPSISGEIVVNGSIQIGTTLLGFAGLSYLGLGVQVPEAEWGSMINEARGYMQQAPLAVLAPGVALFLTVSLFNLLADAYSDYMGLRRKNDE